MYTILNYFTAFWSVVIMNCIQPANWQVCLPVHKWLLPEIVYGWKLKTGQIKIYQSEKDYLKQINEL